MGLIRQKIISCSVCCWLCVARAMLSLSLSLPLVPWKIPPKTATLPYMNSMPLPCHALSCPVLLYLALPVCQHIERLRSNLPVWLLHEQQTTTCLYFKGVTGQDRKESRRRWHADGEVWSYLHVEFTLPIDPLIH